jgi:hypothetical protein
MTNPITDNNLDHWELYWHGRSNELQGDARSDFIRRMQLLIGNLRTTVSQMSTVGNTPYLASSRIQQLNQKLQNSFTDYHQKHELVGRQIQALTTKTVSASLDFSPLKPSGKRPERPERPTRLSSKLDEKIGNVLARTNEFQRREAMMDHVITTEMIACTAKVVEAPFQLLGNVLINDARSICHSNPTIYQACKATQKLGSQVVTYVAKKTGLDQTARDFSNHMKQRAKNLPVMLEKEFGIPRSMGEQYVDSSTHALGFTVTCLIPASKLTSILKTATKPMNSFLRYSPRGRGNKIVTLDEIPKTVISTLETYFHATPTAERLAAILKSGSIERLDMGAYQGAFVSTRPEFNFGRFVLALNRNIEKTGPVLNAEGNRLSCWAGFAKDIPVNANTLEFVAISVKKLSIEEFSKMSKMFSEAAGRPIVIKPLEVVSRDVKRRIAKNGSYVPEKWPTTMEFECSN